MRFKILIGTILSHVQEMKIRQRLSLTYLKNSRMCGNSSQADLEEIKAMIYSTGFYNLKAERIKRVSQIIVDSLMERF